MNFKINLVFLITKKALSVRPMKRNFDQFWRNFHDLCLIKIYLYQLRAHQNASENLRMLEKTKTEEKANKIWLEGEGVKIHKNGQ